MFTPATPEPVEIGPLGHPNGLVSASSHLAGSPTDSVCRVNKVGMVHRYDCMKPKGKLAILVVLFAGVGVLAATAAFDTVEADRTAEVETAGDADALLGLEAGETELAENTNDGLLQITLDEDSDGDGLNENAITSVLPDEGDDGLFTVSNNGNNEIEFTIQDFEADDEVDIYFITTEGQDFDDQVDSELVDDDGTYGLLQDDSGNGGSVTVDSGEELEVGIVFDVGDLDDDNDVFDGDITLEADGTGN